MQQISSAAFSDTKPHYELLDGLRGVAALLVVWYHVFEGYAFAGGTLIESINHGYLAVDFFFILSGFVIGYAYDDRWGKSLTVKNFFKRRLIRLHPMVVMGAVLGVITFCIQGSEQWDGTHVATSMVMWALRWVRYFVQASVSWFMPFLVCFQHTTARCGTPYRIFPFRKNFILLSGTFYLLASLWYKMYLHIPAGIPELFSAAWCCISFFLPLYFLLSSINCTLHGRFEFENRFHITFK